MVTHRDIRAGLKKGEFFLEYQPIVALESGDCVGCEALLRWRRGGQVVGPYDFIPLTEDSSLGGLLTYHVVETAARELGPWLLAHPHLFIGINVPPSLLGRGGIEYAAQQTGYQQTLRRQLVLEVTERGIPDSIGLAEMEAAAQTGVRFALDDVLLDSANLAVLARAKFHIIKIDRRLVAEIQPGAEHPEWLAGLAALLAATELQVIAEGVETGEQARVLREAGVPMAQGFLYSRPLSATAVQVFRAQRDAVPAETLSGPDA